MTSQTIMFDRWCRYRYGAEPSPGATRRLRNAGGLLPTVSAVALTVSLVFLVVPFLDSMTLWDGPTAAVWLLDNYWMVVSLGPMISGQLGLWTWWWLSRRESSRRTTFAASMLVTLTLLPALSVVLVEVLALIALMWLLDAVVQSAGGQPIELYLRQDLVQ